MILSISQYIEALWSPDGRLRSLERLRPLYDEGGMPLFAMPGHGLVDFEVVAGGERHTLRCPLRSDAASATRLRALAEKYRGLGGRFFTEWRVLPAEIVLFDLDGGALEVDILARPTPAGQPLVDFLSRAVVRGDTAAVERALESFEELAEWAEGVGRSGIAFKRLLADRDGALSLAGFSATGETERIREVLRAAAGGEKPAGAAAVGEREGGTSGYGLDGEGNIRLVRDGGGWMYVDRLGRAVIDAVWTAAASFRGGRAEVETHTGKGLIDTSGRAVLEPLYEEVTWDDYWGLAAVMAEGCWGLVDRNGKLLSTRHYDWLGECSEGLLLAQKDDKCGFLDTAGREIIPFIYDDASSFSEGLALVTLGSENFFIDARGDRIG